eukprot:5704943-Amphidinium_carterae.1
MSSLDPCVEIHPCFLPKAWAKLAEVFGLLCHHIDSQKSKKVLREDCQAIMKEIRAKHGKVWEKENMPSVLLKKVTDIMSLGS